jgi:hypothetical protein
MRTEGVIVESLLGQADALDSYARRLQELEVDHREAEVGRDSALAEREAILNAVVNAGDEGRAKLLEALTCPCSKNAAGVHIDVEASSDHDSVMGGGAGGDGTPNP